MMRRKTWSLCAVGLLVAGLVLAGVGLVQAASSTVTIQLDATTGRNLCVFSTAPASWGSDHSTAVLAFGNYVGPETGLTHRCRSYLWFPLAAIPAEAIVKTAMLEVYVNDWPFDGSADMGVYRVAVPWDEDFNWDTRPAVEMLPLATTNIQSTPGWRSWDVTTEVRAWLVGQRPNHGLMLGGAPTPESLIGAGWACAGPGRTGGDPAHRPRLVVVYTLPPTEIPEPATLVLMGAGLAGLTALWTARSQYSSRKAR